MTRKAHLRALLPQRGVTRYVAFLRAINVGGRFVKMDHLRGVFESIGLSNVNTFIQSGNVIFESSVKRPANLELAIEARLQKVLGYPVVTFLRSPSELAEIAGYQPFGGAERDAAASLYVCFLRNEPSRESQQKLLAFRSRIDDFHVHRREVYWLRRKGEGESDFSGPRMEKAIGPATVRNVTTVTRIAAKYPQ